MPRLGEKLQKLTILIGVWSLLLVSMIAYELYFVSSQQAFLKEREFHTLEQLAAEVSAQVQRAQTSTGSFVQLTRQLDKEQREKDDPVLAEFLKLYLPGPWNGTVDKHTRNALAASRSCLVNE